MFASLVSGAVEPELVKVAKAAQVALSGVRQRLVEQSQGDDPVTVLAARQQLKALDAWEPGIAEFLEAFGSEHGGAV